MTRLTETIETTLPIGATFAYLADFANSQERDPGVATAERIRERADRSGNLLPLGGTCRQPGQAESTHRLDLRSAAGCRPRRFRFRRLGCGHYRVCSNADRHPGRLHGRYHSAGRHAARPAIHRRNLCKDRPGRRRRDPAPTRRAGIRDCVGPTVRVAVVVSGVGGLTAAYAMRRDHEVRLFEREPVVGGHVKTVTVDADAGPVTVEYGIHRVQRAHLSGVRWAARRAGGRHTAGAARRAEGLSLGCVATPSSASSPTNAG